MTLSGVYGFWKFVSKLHREESRRYLEMFYILKFRELVWHTNSTPMQRVWLSTHCFLANKLNHFSASDDALYAMHSFKFKFSFSHVWYVQVKTVPLSHEGES